jgi:hypothetical protein
MDDRAAAVLQGEGAHMHVLQVIRVGEKENDVRLQDEGAVQGGQVIGPAFGSGGLDGKSGRALVGRRGCQKAGVPIHAQGFRATIVQDHLKRGVGRQLFEAGAQLTPGHVEGASQSHANGVIDYINDPLATRRNLKECG